MNRVSRDVYDLFRRVGVADADLLQSELGDRLSPQDLAECVQSFVSLDILRDAADPGTPLAIQNVEDIALSTIVLNVNTGCNLACTYCYKEDLTTPAKGERMDFETARKSIELLLRQAAARDSVNVVFFGGEPLSNICLLYTSPSPRD